MKFSVGDRIDHRLYGTGKIRRIDGGLVVVYIDRFDMDVRATPHELELIPPPKSVVKSTPRAAATSVEPEDDSAPARPIPKPTNGKSLLLQSVEALRFGVVPTVRLEQLTVGYPRLKEWVTGRLPHANNGCPQISEIAGPFGAGKSHTSAVVRHVARQCNYLTAHVEVDGHGVTLSDPAAMLHALWTTLKGSDFDSSTPVLDLYVRVAKAGATLPRVAPRGVDRIGENMKAVRHLIRHGCLDAHSYALDALLSSSVEYTATQVRDDIRKDFGYHPQEIKLRPMIGRSVDDRPYDFVEAIGGIAILAQLCGFQGLVVTIDEFEVETWRLPSEGRRRLLNLLSVLGEYLRGETGHRHAPLSMFFATTGDEGSRGDEFIRTVVPSDGDGSFRVRAVSAQGRKTLARRICELYSDAYELGEDYDPTLAERVERGPGAPQLNDSDSTRVFIKSITALLDNRHGPPARIA